MAQDFEEYEVLLVDDGSSDASTAIALEYAGALPDKVHYLEHDGHENRGMSASRNLGIRRARGEFIAFIDADDVWRPTKLREQLSLLEAQPAAGMVCGTVNYWRSWEGGRDRLTPTGHLRDGMSWPPSTALMVHPLGAAGAPCPSDVMLRSSVVDEVGGFEDEFTGFYEDCAFFVKIFLASPVWFSSRIWLNYRLHDGSCSSAVTPHRHRQIRGAFLDWLSGYIQHRPIAEKETVERAIRRARSELDHPVVGRLVRRLRSLWLASRSRAPTAVAKP